MISPPCSVIEATFFDISYCIGKLYFRKIRKRIVCAEIINLGRAILYDKHYELRAVFVILRLEKSFGYASVSRKSENNAVSVCSRVIKYVVV